MAEILCRAEGVKSWEILRAAHLDYVQVIGIGADGKDGYGGVVTISHSGIVNWEWHNRDKVNGYERDVLEAYQRLIELGYAIPYKNQSLFELGIAIESK